MSLVYTTVLTSHCPKFDWLAKFWLSFIVFKKVFSFENVKSFPKSYYRGQLILPLLQRVGLPQVGFSRELPAKWEKTLHSPDWSANHKHKTNILVNKVKTSISVTIKPTCTGIFCVCDIGEIDSRLWNWWRDNIERVQHFKDILKRFET